MSWESGRSVEGVSTAGGTKHVKRFVEVVLQYNEIMLHGVEGGGGLTVGA